MNKTRKNINTHNKTKKNHTFKKNDYNFLIKIRNRSSKSIFQSLRKN